jgi:arylsulfatase
MAKTDKPNILVIWGDDIGIANLSCYSHGLMDYRTPNIDRLAKEGMMFTDSYGEQSCTAGRSSFITGQSVYRTSLSKVGVPAAPVGMPDDIVTIAACHKIAARFAATSPSQKAASFTIDDALTKMNDAASGAGH